MCCFTVTSFVCAWELLLFMQPVGVMRQFRSELCLCFLFQERLGSSRGFVSLSLRVTGPHRQIKVVINRMKWKIILNVKQNL